MDRLVLFPLQMLYNRPYKGRSCISPLVHATPAVYAKSTCIKAKQGCILVELNCIDPQHVAFIKSNLNPYSFLIKSVRRFVSSECA